MGICSAPTPGSMVDMPAPDNATACTWRMRSLLTMSGSSPNTPPAKMVSLTLPPEIAFQRSPMRASTSYQGDDSGARVAILISICCARASGNRANRARQGTIRRVMADSIALLRRGRGFQDEVVEVGQQPACAALGDEVGQAVFVFGFGIDGQGLGDGGTETGGVLRRDAGILGVRNIAARAGAFRKLDGAVEVLLHAVQHFRLAQPGPAAFKRDEELGN